MISTLRDAHRRACSLCREANHKYHRATQKPDTPKNRRNMRVLELEWRHQQAICRILAIGLEQERGER